MVIGLEFTLINTRPAKNQMQIKMYNYVLEEELLKTMQSQLNDTVKVSSKNRRLALEINKQCQKIKSMILENSIGQPTIPVNFEDQGVLMEEGGLGPEFFDDGMGVHLLSDLKTIVAKYNSLDGRKIPVEQSILSIDADLIGRYSNFSDLTSLTQLQLFILNTKGD